MTSKHYCMTFNYVPWIRTFRMTFRMTFNTWDFRGVSKEDFEGDFEGYFDGSSRRCLGGLEGVQVSFGPGLVQAWFRFQLKFNF